LHGLATTYICTLSLHDALPILAVDEVDRRLVAWDQALVAVGRRVRERQDGRRVGQQAADVPAADVGEPGVAGLVVEQRLARLPRSEEHTSELQSRENLVCRLLL